jgi:hypothetical protein
MPNEEKEKLPGKSIQSRKDTEIEPLSDAALEEVSGGTDTGSPLCIPPDIV